MGLLSGYNPEIHPTTLTLGLFIFLLAAASPLLTAARLWQLKEWRVDRLTEHLKAEGFLVLFGRIRPLLALIMLASAFFLRTQPGNITMLGTAIGLFCFAGLSVLQAALRSQPIPVWTAKAALLVCVSFLLTLLLSYVLWPAFAFVYPLLIVGQPLFLFAAWLLLLPVDRALKTRIFRKTQRAREALPILTVIAITGSVGKTTTKELLRCTLNSVFPVVTPEYVNSELGVAKWFLREVKKGTIRSGATVVVEMGAYSTGEVALLCRILKPHTGIVTSVGTQHIALFGSMEKILESEREMPSALPKHGLLLLNGDNADCRSLKTSAGCQVITVGTTDGCDLKAEITEDQDGLTITTEEVTIRIPLHGKHNATNVLLALAASRAVGLSDDEIAKALRTFSPLPRTFKVERRGGVLLLDDTHNMSPQSMAAGIDWAASVPEQPRVLLTTGIIEQGKDEEYVMEEMGRKARGVFDRAVFLGTRGREAFDRGFGRASEQPAAAEPVPAGALLACIGRVPAPLIDQLLPQ